MSAPEPVGDWNDYLWIVVCGGLASCFMAWGIGANDVANSFATSVGSRTLKLWQAVIIAGIFEFAGAVGLGGEVTKTVASGIANVDMFIEFPEIYMYGMLCALTVAGLWLLLATMWCFAVSTTHSITGSIMGFALVYGGWGGVLWFQESGDFPFCTGFTPIILSWFFSPIIGGILAAIFFNFCRFFILRHKRSTLLAVWFIPFLIFMTLFICLMFVLAKGAKSEMEKNWPCSKTTGFKGLPSKDCSDLYGASAWIAAAVAAGVALVAGSIAIPLMLKKLRHQAEAMENAVASVKDADGPTDVEKAAAVGTPAGNTSGSDVAAAPLQRHESIHIYEIPDDVPWYKMPLHYTRLATSKMHRQIIKGLFFDVHVGASYNAAIIAIHNGAEIFKPETERVFSYLQVISACCVAFAHGSNDVANSIGPFSAIYYVYHSWEVPGDKADTPKWIFAMGGAGIVVGLATYGYNIIMTIGVQMVKLSPSRGFAAELAAGMTIALSSFFGIPVSTTQIIVGSETGVGLCESIRGVHWLLLFKTMTGWVLTIVMALIFCAALFAAGAYAPSIIMSQQLSDYNAALFEMSNQTYSKMATLNDAQRSNTLWWTGTAAQVAPMPYNGSALKMVIDEQNQTYYDALMGKEQRNAMYLDQALYYINQTMSLEDQYVNSTIGQTT